MRIWLITDTHFGHDKLIEYGRPEGFTERIFENLNVVKPDDLLIHLGDFCIGNDEKWHTHYMQMLDCKHWLIRGNHDSKSNSWYMSHGWDVVAEYLSIEMFAKKILFSHRPMAWDGYYDVNIHGHFHDTDHRRIEGEFLKIKNAYQKLLALEFTNYQPVLLGAFLANSRKATQKLTEKGQFMSDENTRGASAPEEVAPAATPAETTPEETAE